MNKINAIKIVDSDTLAPKSSGLTDEINICRFYVRKPFSTLSSFLIKDDEGKSWFFCRKEDGCKAIENDPIQVIYSKPGSEHFLTIHGHISILEDAHKKNFLFHELTKKLLDQSIEEEIELVKVKPESAYYWDSEYGRMLSFFSRRSSLY